MTESVRDAAARLFDTDVWPEWGWAYGSRHRPAEIRELTCLAAADPEHHGDLTAAVLRACGNPDAARTMLAQCDAVISTARASTTTPGRD